MKLLKALGFIYLTITLSLGLVAQIIIVLTLIEIY